MKKGKSTYLARTGVIWISVGLIMAVAALGAVFQIGAQKGERRVLLLPRSEPRVMSSNQTPSFSPYSDFQAMSLEQLKTLQVKLTYVGIQGKAIASLAFTSSFNTLDLNKFIP